MLTTKQKTTFRQATAEWNCGDHEDLDSAYCEEDEVVSTRDSLDDFIAKWGKPHDEETEVGMLFVWEGRQRAKGEPRGTLFVMDFGEVRAAYFTA